MVGREYELLLIILEPGFCELYVLIAELELDSWYELLENEFKLLGRELDTVFWTLVWGFLTIWFKSELLVTEPKSLKELSTDDEEIPDEDDDEEEEG